MNSRSLNQYRRVAEYASGKRLALAIIVGLTLLTAFVAALAPWPVKLLVDYSLGDVSYPPALQAYLELFPGNMETLAGISLAGIASILLFTAATLLDAVLSRLWAVTGQSMVYTFSSDLYEKVCRLTLGSHVRRSVGDLLSRLSVDTYSVFSVVQALLVAPIRHLAVLVLVAVFAWYMDPILTLLAFVMMPVLVATALYAGPRLKIRSKEAREAQSQIMSLVQRTLTALPMVQAYGTEHRNQLEFETLTAKAVSHSQWSALLSSAYGLVNGLLMTTATGIVLFVGSQRVMAEELTIGSLLVFLAYLEMIRGAMIGLTGLYGNLRVTEASMDRVFELLGSTEVIPEAPGAAELRTAPDGGVGDVQFHEVTVGYDPGRPVLQKVELVARSGETIALVGPTGSGKSTLVSLLPRFLDPWEGCVTIGGRDVRQMTLSSLRSHVGLVLQESFLLPISVAENIGYGRPEASRAEIVAAAEAANADEFIRQLPEGYDTILGERGATLSGGQGQRLAIARALLKDAPILILDEPTSALDAKTEASLLEALERLMHGRTTFIVAHRLSTIQHADKIIVLDNGWVTGEMAAQP